MPRFQPLNLILNHACRMLLGKRGRHSPLKTLLNQQINYITVLFRNVFLVCFSNTGRVFGLLFWSGFLNPLSGLEFEPVSWSGF